MALVLANRVQESATANTTVSFTLTGAVLGFQTFAVIGDTNTTFYSATDASGNWEVGLGTYSSTGPTLTRDTIYASSNSGSAVTFSGTVNVFVTYPSGKSVNLDASNNVSALGTVSSGTWQGSTVGVAYGGTGVTASSGANSVVLRDASQNITANSITQAISVVTSAGGTTVLTVASPHFQILVGTSTQTFQLPDATLLPEGSSWIFDNDSTQNLTVTDGAGGPVDTVAPGGYTTVFLEADGTVAGTWGRFGMIPSEVNWGTNSLDLGGSTVVTNGTWQGNAVQPAYGGTGLTTFVGANNALYSTGASTLTAGTLPVVAGGTGAVTLTGYVYGNGTGAMTASTSIPNAATTATSANTASAIVQRDASGNFSAGTITANLTGTASSATSATSAATSTNLAGGVAGAVPYQSGVGTTGFSAAGTSGQVLTSAGTSAPTWTTATNANTASAIVARDASGNFSAGTITATLSGTATNVSGTVAVANGGTGATSQTAYAVLCGGTTSTSAYQSVASVGTAGQVLTSNGAGALPTFQAAAGGFAAGTVMLFGQTAAPTGWTKLTTHDNKALRVVSGTAGSGGSAAFTTAFGTPSVSGTVGGTVGATTLTTTQIPSHTHNSATPLSTASVSNTCGGSIVGVVGNSGATGGGGSHTHSFSGSLSSATAAINVAYVDVILASKN